MRILRRILLVLLAIAFAAAAAVYRVRSADLRDAGLDGAQLAQRVERDALKTPSDGITTDLDGNVYLTDADESAIVRLGPDRKLTTLLMEPRIRWPDGMSFGPDGWLYFTCMRAAPGARALRRAGAGRGALPDLPIPTGPGRDPGSLKERA